MLIVIDPPRFNLLSRIVQRGEYLRVHALVSNAPVKTLNHRILEGFPRPNEIELHSVRVGPSIEGLGRQFAPIVHGDHGERKIRFDSLTAATPVIHDGQRANSPAI